jgi:hypothetical protein
MKYKKQTDPNSTKEKRSKRIFIAAQPSFLLLATTSYFVATKGFDYDTIIGHPTKELLEGEWIRSTYGNPGAIETPKVLKRIDLTKSLPKNGYN